jgi:ketosteroid isomerase-like protein
MKRFVQTMVLILTGIIFSGNSFAQQWSNEQKDVWAGVEKYWEVSAKGDAQGFMSYFDDSYLGWEYESAVPQNKSNTAKWIANQFKNNSTVVYTITPVAIWVKGDFAFADYFYSQLIKNNQTGKEEYSSGKWTDILMKKDGRWILIGDQGGRTSKSN